MKFIKKFNLHQDYLDYMSNSPILPNLSYCLDVEDIHLTDIYNGYKFVDLGLPSGTLWATKNIGASSITDTGLYFAWGETTGYTASQVGVDKNFYDDDYIFYDVNYSTYGDNKMIKYNKTDGKTILETIDDAATVHIGNNVHIPTVAQYQELLNTSYCTLQKVTDYQGSGVTGLLFTSVADNTKTLFMPCAGGCIQGNVEYVNDYCYSWANSVYTSTCSQAKFFYMTYGNANVSNYFRYYGVPLRGVIG